MGPLGDGSDVPRCCYRFMRLQLLFGRAFIEIEQLLRLDLVGANFGIFIVIVLNKQLFGRLDFRSINPLVIHERV